MRVEAAETYTAAETYEDNYGIRVPSGAGVVTTLSGSIVGACWLKFKPLHDARGLPRRSAAAPAATTARALAAAQPIHEFGLYAE